MCTDILSPRTFIFCLLQFPLDVPGCFPSSHHCLVLNTKLISNAKVIVEKYSGNVFAKYDPDPLGVTAHLSASRRVQVLSCLFQEDYVDTLSGHLVDSKHGYAHR